MFVDQGWIVKDFVVGQRCAGRDDGVAELADEVDADPVLGNTNTGGLPFGQHHLGYHFRALKDKGIGARKQAFHGVSARPRIEQGAFRSVIDALRPVEGIGTVALTDVDIVRHPLIAEIAKRITALEQK